MADWVSPSEDEQLTPLFIHTWGWLMGMSLVHGTVSGLTPPGSSAWVTANQAMFLPLTLPFPYVVRRLFWHIGSTGGGNTDIGLYSVGGTAIFTAGSTAQTVFNGPQYVAPGSPLVLSPGRYFLAMAHSVTSANHVYGHGGLTAPLARLAGLYQQPSALPLPTTATLAQSAGGILPLMGITRTASGY